MAACVRNTERCALPEERATSSTVFTFTISYDVYFLSSSNFGKGGRSNNFLRMSNKTRQGCVSRIRNNRLVSLKGFYSKFSSASERSTDERALKPTSTSRPATS